LFIHELPRKGILRGLAGKLTKLIAEQGQFEGATGREGLAAEAYCMASAPCIEIIGDVLPPTYST